MSGTDWGASAGSTPTVSHRRSSTGSWRGGGRGPAPMPCGGWLWASVGWSGGWVREILDGGGERPAQAWAGSAPFAVREQLIADRRDAFVDGQQRRARRQDPDHAPSVVEVDRHDRHAGSLCDAIEAELHRAHHTHIASRRDPEPEWTARG